MQNLTRLLDFHARNRPDADAVIYAGSRISWHALQARVRRTAGGLRAAGIGPDSIVALVMKNSAAFLELVYAINHIGAVSLPINFRLNAEEMGYILNHAGVDLAIFDTEFQSLAAAVSCPYQLLDEAGQRDSTSVFGGHGDVVAAHPREGGDLFRLMYTSGTTDRPKGVMHSLDNFQWKNFDLIVALSLTADDRLGVVGPLYHVGGSELPGLAVHAVGGCMVVLREFDPAAVLKMIEDEAITGIWLAPVMTAGLLETDASADTSSLRWCVAGGEKTPENRIRQFTALFPNARYVDAYGMTETVSGDALMEPGRELDKIGSVGRAVAHVEIEIRDDAGTTCPPNVPGEICMRGRKVTAGYWKDPEKTAATFHADGFLRSGDVGYMDEDGFIFLTDRKKDMIISGGENIASSEVERVIYDLPQVLDVAVVGRPNDKWGEVPVAVIVLKPDATLDFDQLNSHCRGKLAAFKCPKDVHFTDELPRNPSGKILKRVVREKMLELEP